MTAGRMVSPGSKRSGPRPRYVWFPPAAAIGRAVKRQRNRFDRFVTDGRGSGAARWLSSRARWLVAGVAFLASLGLRLVDLDRVRAFVFDEAYYVPQAWSLWQHGIERKFAKDGQAAFATGNIEGAFTTGGDFVVHPPLGKWIIGLGELIDPRSPVDWRLSVAVAGALTVALVAALAMHLTGSWLWGGLAAILLAVDGTSFVESRTGILDGILTLFVVAGAAAAAMDRGPGSGRWLRPWRLTAAVCFGLATGVKFSGALYLLTFLALAIVWDLRRPLPNWKAKAGEASRTALSVLVPGGLAYAVTWTGWFLSADGYGRSSMSNVWSSWVKTQFDMLSLGGAINSPHHWSSGPWGWLIQWRPTMFYTVTAPCEGAAGTCHQVVTSLGTAPIWWLGTLALVVLGWQLARHGDRNGALVLAFFAAGYVPWWLMTDRTIFAFYTVTLAPFVVLALVLALADLGRRPGLLESAAPWVTGALLVASVIWFWAYWPVYTGLPIPESQWSSLLFWVGWR